MYCLRHYKTKTIKFFPSLGRQQLIRKKQTTRNTNEQINAKYW